jgi:hypothetical protein
MLEMGKIRLAVSPVAENKHICCDIEYLKTLVVDQISFSTTSKKLTKILSRLAKADVNIKGHLFLQDPHHPHLIIVKMVTNKFAETIKVVHRTIGDNYVVGEVFNFPSQNVPGSLLASYTQVIRKNYILGASYNCEDGSIIIEVIKECHGKDKH